MKFSGLNLLTVLMISGNIQLASVAQFLKQRKHFVGAQSLCSNPNHHCHYY